MAPACIQAIDVPWIINAARDADVAVEIVVPIGETVQQRTPVAIVHGTADPSLDSVVVKAIRTGAERTFEQDPSLAFRVFVDIALRAVSPAINDPTTAVQVLDSEESLLRMLIGRDLDVGLVTGPSGRVRVLLTLPDWDDYVALSFDELIDMGAGHVQIRRRLERLLRDLIALAPASRRAPLQTRLDGLASGRPRQWTRLTAQRFGGRRPSRARRRPPCERPLAPAGPEESRRRCRSRRRSVVNACCRVPGSARSEDPRDPRDASTGRRGMACRAKGERR